VEISDNECVIALHLDSIGPKVRRSAGRVNLVRSGHTTLPSVEHEMKDPEPMVGDSITGPINPHSFPRILRS